MCDDGSSYSSSNDNSPEDSFRESELDDVPMWMPEDSSDAGGGASTRRPAPQLSSLGLLGRSQGSNDGSATARGPPPPPAMGKLQLGSLNTSRADTSSAAPGFPPQRERGGSQRQDDGQQAASTSSAHQQQHQQQRGRVSDSSINDSSLLPSSSTPGAEPRAAIPSLSLGGLRPPAPSSQDAQAQQPAASTSQASSSGLGPSQSVAVSLLSYAFVTSTPSPQDASPSDSMSALLDGITQRIACQLGVRPQELRLFSLNELDGSQTSSRGQDQEAQHHVAALVQNSGFSMAALEEMLAWNQQLQSMQSTHAQTIATMHQDYKDATAENKQLVLQVAAKDHELTRLEEQNQKKNAEIESMRLAMQQGEEQRQQLVSVISMLKQEFLSLRSVIGGEAQS